ncbi:hypothetical protein [Catellatospora sichuanensis]|uniref:hypothetical protein n=1 Tax=Catellatospora sichuanensis TaxID=1969805 RepID=UPI001181DC67|nr:hypothetical protein [Catellatospora sichuanensis]
MTDVIRLADAADAARLVALGLRPKQRPARDLLYADLVRRYQQDPLFEELVEAVAAGMGLAVLAVTAQSGAVLAAMTDSVFEVKIDDYARRTQLRDRQLEKTLHGLIHIAVAALAFPRPDDLASDTYVGRVVVDYVDQVVREACRKLEDRARAAEENHDPLEGAPALERAWRVYARRAEAASTRDGRQAANTTRAMISKALKFLTDQGFLHQMSEDGGGTFRTTSRYQIQVRELAADSAFDELLRLGVISTVSPTGTLRTSDEKKPESARV